MAGAIRIAILGENRGIRQSVNQTTGLLESLNRKASKSGTVMKGVLGANIISAGASAVAGSLGTVKDKYDEAVTAASNLQQSTGAVDAVFGKSAASIKKSAQGAAQSLGLSRNAYQELASTLGAGLKNQGIKDFAGQTKGVITLGADLAAQFGGSTSQAVEAIGSLMRGEADPIEKYGVSIKESAIAAELAAKGQSKLKGKSLEQAKAQARLSLLFKQTKDAQGAFAREGDSLANIQQRNAAATENLKAKFGTIFLPVMTQVQNLIGNKVLPVLGRLVPVVQRVVSSLSTSLGPAFKTVQAAIGPALALLMAFLGGDGGVDFQGFLANLAPIKTGLLTVFTSVGGALQTIVPIVLQVLGTLVSAYQSNAPKIGEALRTLGSIVTEVAGVIKTVWAGVGPVILPVLKSVFTTVVAVVGGALKIVLGIVKTVGALLRGDWKGVWDGIKTIVSGAVQIVRAVVTNAMTQTRAVVSRILPGIRATAANAWNGIKAATSAAWSAVRNSVSAALAAARAQVVSRLSSILASARSAWNNVKTATSQAWTSIKTAVTQGVANVTAKVRELPGRAKSALGNIGSALHSAGVNLVRGFISGIGSALGFVADKARSIATTAISAAKRALGIASPSKVFRQIGAFVGKGFILGLQGTEAQAKSAVTKMVGYLKKEAKAKGKAGSRARAALRIVNRLDNRALAIAKAKTAVTAKLSAAQARLNDLLQQRAEYAANVKSGAIDYASIIGIKLSDDLPLTNDTLVQGLKERLAAIVNFRVKIDALRKAGLNTTTLGQIIAAGVEGGTEVANTLASGGSAVLKEVNSLQGQINSQATALGTSSASAMYQAGIQAQQGLIKGLLADQKALQVAANQIAKTLSDAVKKALKIKSPSRVFRGIGDNVTRGLQIGLDDKATKRAGAVLAGSLVSGFGDPRLAATAFAGAGTGGTTVINVTVQTQVGTSPAEVGRQVVSMIKEYEKTSGKKVLVKS